MVEQFTYFNSVKQSTISISFEKVDYFTFWLGRLFYKVDQNVVPQAYIMVWQEKVLVQNPFQENIPRWHMKLADLFVKKSKDKLLDKHFLVYDDRMICA